MINISLIQSVARVRAFEEEVRQAVIDGRVKCQVYLSTGQESIAVAVACALDGRYHRVLAQHRSHSVYLAFGGDPIRLRDELLGLPTGCSGGAGGSPCIQDQKRGIVGHIGLIGDQVPIASGIAYAHLKAKGKKAYEAPVVCFLGDGAVEEDYVLGSLGFIAKNKLPLLIVVEDNNLSVLTPKDVRRDWAITNVATGFGINALQTDDTPERLYDHVKSISPQSLPYILEVSTTRKYWHVGVEQDPPIPGQKQDTWSQYMDECYYRAFSHERKAIDKACHEAKMEMARLWA